MFFKISSNLKILFISFLVFYCPFFKIFTNYNTEGSVFNISSLLNFISIIFSVIILIKYKYFYYYNKKGLLLIIVLSLTYILNYILTQYSSFNWLLNSLGFILIFYTVFCIILNSNNNFKNYFIEYNKITIILILSILIILFLITYFLKASEIYYNLTINYFNGIINQLSSVFNISKQNLGLLFNILVIWHISFWNRIHFKNKIVFILFLIVGFPFYIGIRTSLLTISLILIFICITRIKYSLLSFCLIIPFLIILSYDFLFSTIKMYYNRLPSLLFAISFLKNNIFGIGNGGYHIYVSEMQDILTYKFSSDSKLFWLAPESDIVYFISSFGILSLVFLLLFTYLFINFFKIYKKGKKVDYTVKYLVLLSMSILFSGISQDFAYSLIWWVLFALGFGVTFNFKKNCVK